MTYDAVPLIPRAVLFGNPERSTPDISPDGTRVGYVAPLDACSTCGWDRSTTAPSST